MKSIQVFCGSSTGLNPIYAQIAGQTGTMLAERGIRLVYGAGSVGLMGIMADAALAAGGQVTGVIPHFLRDMEVCHEGLTELVLTDSMHDRKVEMLRLSDAAIALPGGFGTLDEIFEVITLVQLQQTFQPIGFLNVNGFYDPMIAHCHKMHEEGFVRKMHLDMIHFAADLEELLEKMSVSAPITAKKWWK
ncbi:LOG family protein [Flavilitoribacter nigricans]|uniref:Cytokinin riboside 5'-monophosphate phosphoribohydrolase n=1 Tax=Flavilitoribacter nigricans (strain ATCC 23147 / DSM 23189 / NBRC 102662 / NCIMB 1420 / SS-2) TaxID=1122177 RepID=A0A2D0ND33_FLAN2|nr:TIGR00730 family Rossman fold protein [Flavilitoribacter nigricans]PHN06424.1 TIGR00730 family Rossman fold protein [Flavilitoribacter nigricans DSM 23189 = NBRC 102662]